MDVHCIPLWCIPVNCIPVQCIPLHWGCESVRGHYLPSLIHAISCSLGSKNGNAQHLVPTVLHNAGVQKIPWARGAARLFSSIAELNSSGFPELQDSNIHICTSISKHPHLSTHLPIPIYQHCTIHQHTHTKTQTEGNITNSLFTPGTNHNLTLAFLKYPSCSQFL